jgi:mannose/fructose/N-acetylgalactosamine-specific phosphotransferase system component IIC
VNITELLAVALLGGLLALDSVGVAQLMVSRPIVAATLTGLAFGAPGEGLIVGALLEMLAMETMPFGASRYLEWSSGSVVAAVLIARLPALSAPGLLIALICALGTSWFAGTSMIVLRKANARMVVSRRADIEAGEPSALLSLQLTGIGLDFLRGALVVVAGMLVSLPLTRFFLDAVSSSDRVTVGIVVAIPVAVALAASWRMFAIGPRRRFLLVGGALLGAALVIAR